MTARKSRYPPPETVKESQLLHPVILISRNFKFVLLNSQEDIERLYSND
jgi:hypothetical protein